MWITFLSYLLLYVGPVLLVKSFLYLIIISYPLLYPFHVKRKEQGGQVSPLPPLPLFPFESQPIPKIRNVFLRPPAPLFRPRSFVATVL